MSSLGPDWRHDQLCQCCGVPDLLPVPSRWVLTAKGSADVTVCAPLLFTWSLVRIVLRSVSADSVTARFCTQARCPSVTHTTEHNTLFIPPVCHTQADSCPLRRYPRELTTRDLKSHETTFANCAVPACH